MKTRYWIFLICLLVTGCGQQTTVQNTNQEKVKQAEVDVAEKETKEQQKPETIVEEMKQQEENIPTYIKEENVVDYFKTAEKEVTSLLQEEKTESVKEKIAQKFITLVDFIYYDTEIGGIKFKDLKESLQNEIMEILNRMDGAIETKIPGYKDSLKEKSLAVTTYVKEKTGEMKETISSKVEDTIGTENYNHFKEAKEDMKESFQNTAEVVGNTASTIYQKGKEKVKDWYQDLKNKYEK